MIYSKKMHKKIILIHGNGGATVNDHWFPYIQKNLVSLGLEVTAQTFPDNKLARASVWLPFLKNILKADENTILLGHSSGAVAAMKYAEEHTIYGSILVAAYHTDLNLTDEKKSGYFDTTWQWENIKRNQKWVMQYASRNDPFIPIKEALFVHEKLKSEYTEYPSMGHFVGWNGKIKKLPDMIINQIKIKLEIPY